jgi:hypothetical protein
MSRGLRHFLTIDDVDFEDFGLNPGEVSVPRQLLETAVRMANGSTTLYGQLVDDGHADAFELLTFNLAWRKEEISEAMSQIRMDGGHHRIAIWKESSATYTAKAGQTQFLLPMLTQNAPQVLGKSTTTFPFRVWVKPVGGSYAAVDQEDIIYANGPTTAPAAGEIAVARDAHTSGTYRDSTEFRFGTALAAGEKVRIRWFALHRVYFGPTDSNFKATTEDERVTLLEG